jgi:hypothetical protein
MDTVGDWPTGQGCKGPGKDLLAEGGDPLTEGGANAQCRGHGLVIGPARPHHPHRGLGKEVLSPAGTRAPGSAGRPVSLSPAIPWN